MKNKKKRRKIDVIRSGYGEKSVVLEIEKRKYKKNGVDEDVNVTFFLVKLHPLPIGMNVHQLCFGI